MIEALNTLDFGAKTVVVRVNGTDTPHYYKDLIAVVERAGDAARRDHAAEGPHARRRRDDRQAADPDRARAAASRSGRIGIEAQIEDATGLIACEAIAAASPRMETLIFGPGDYSAAVGIPITTIGAAPDGLSRRPPQLRLLAARGGGPRRRHPGDRRPVRARRRRRGPARARALARALGLDGKWTIHPGQIETVNEVFSPAREQWERAEAMLAAYDQAHRDGAGAAVFEGEMIDEANRKMAERIAFAGRAAGTSDEPRRPRGFLAWPRS